MSIVSADTHQEVVDVTDPATPPPVLMVVANPGVSTTLGWPVGFWAAELFHPFYEFIQKRYAVTIGSPEGGGSRSTRCSDPRDESRWSADDLISMGALHPRVVAQLEDTPALRDLDSTPTTRSSSAAARGRCSSSATTRDLKRAIAAFYEARKPTAALCHGTCALLDVRLSDGAYLIEGGR